MANLPPVGLFPTKVKADGFRRANLAEKEVVAQKSKKNNSNELTVCLLICLTINHNFLRTDSALFFKSPKMMDSKCASMIWQTHLKKF